MELAWQWRHVSPHSCWMSCLDETMAERGAYGLTVGQSKKQAFDQVDVAFQQLSPGGGRILMEIRLDEARAHSLGMEPGLLAMVQIHCILRLLSD